MGNKEAFLLLREIRDLLQVLVVQQSPELINMLRAVPCPPRHSQAWSVCGHKPVEDADIDEIDEMDKFE